VQNSTTFVAGVAIGFTQGWQQALLMIGTLPLIAGHPAVGTQAQRAHDVRHMTLATLSVATTTIPVPLSDLLAMPIPQALHREHLNRTIGLNPLNLTHVALLTFVYERV
jgi:hypothetical protein